MDNRITHKNVVIELQMNEEPIFLVGRGWVHVAMLCGSYNRDQLKDLIGLQLWGTKVLAVESFCIDNQTNRPIGLLVNRRLW